MKINYSAPINQLGYGIAGLNILKALVDTNNEVSLFPIGNVEIGDLTHKSLLTGTMDNAKLYDPSAPSIRMWHQHDLAQHVGRGIHIGFPIFELDQFTTQELHQMEAMDMLFVCSHWAKGVLEGIGFSNVYVVPLGVDSTIFNPSNSLRTCGSVKFINIGKWEKRKGHDILLECFDKAFENIDDVELWMVTSNPFLSDQETSYWESSYREKLGRKVKFIPRQATQYDIARLIGMADCGVFPSRAEGWNLDLLEVMACGKPVITTNYSAHTEFCSHKNSFLIDCEGLEPAHDQFGKWFKGQGRWMKFTENNKEQLIHWLRHVYGCGPSYSENGLKTAQHFSWDNSALEFVRHLL